MKHIAYKVIQNKETGFIEYYEATGLIEYPNGIPEPNIGITAEEHTKAFSPGMIGKIKGEKFIVEELPLPSQEEVIQNWLNILDINFRAKKQELSADLTLAQLIEDEKGVENVKKQFIELKTDFEDKKEKAEKGINPFEETE